jgi:hypothetical protein
MGQSLQIPHTWAQSLKWVGIWKLKGVIVFYRSWRYLRTAGKRVDWRKPRNEAPRDCWPSIVAGKRIKSRVTWRVWKKTKRHIGVLVSKLKERGHLEDLWVDGNNLKLDLKETDVTAWTGLIWPNKEVGGGLLWTR